MQLDQLIKKHRTYPDGTFRHYDFHFNKWVERSFIQQQNDDTPMSGAEFIDTGDLRTLEAKFLEYKDDGSKLADKFGTPNPYQKMNTMQDARAEFQRFEFQTERQKQQATNRGERFKKGDPTKRQLQAEAWYSVKLIEKDWLGNKIKELQNESVDDDVEERKRMMHSVPLGGVESINYETGRGHISYMKVESLPGDGLICILDKASPYNGMTVLDFREFILPQYRLAQNKLYNERLDAWKTSDKKASMPTMRDTFPKWPLWPEGIPNHLNGKANGQASLQQKSAPKKLVRTKR